MRKSDAGRLVEVGCKAEQKLKAVQACRSALAGAGGVGMAVATVQTFTDANFETAVLKAGTPVLVDFWAEWCGPCKRLGPTIDALALDYGDKVAVGKLNVDHNQDTTIKYNVRGIPALLLFKGGQVVDQVVGVAAKDEIKKVIDKHL